MEEKKQKEMIPHFRLNQLQLVFFICFYGFNSLSPATTPLSISLTFFFFFNLQLRVLARTTDFLESEIQKHWAETQKEKISWPGKDGHKKEEF